MRYALYYKSSTPTSPRQQWFSQLFTSPTKAKEYLAKQVSLQKGIVMGAGVTKHHIVDLLTAQKV